MESVLIVASREYDPKLTARIPSDHQVSEGADGTTVVEYAGSRVYISRNDAVRDDLDSDRLRRILSLVPDPVFYTIDYSDIESCRSILSSLANDSRLFVDNDHGVLLPGSDFVSALRARPDWDWRRDQT